MNNTTFITPPVEADIQLAAALAVASRPSETAVAEAKAQHPSHRTRVLIESPLSAPSKTGLGLNQLYGRAALRDSLLRGEAPMASHLLYAQTFVLDDTDPDEHQIGMLAGFSWLPLVERVVVYIDRGITRGMKEGIRRAEILGVTLEERSLDDWARG